MDQQGRGVAAAIAAGGVCGGGGVETEDGAGVDEQRRRRVPRLAVQGAAGAAARGSSQLASAAARGGAPARLRCADAADALARYGGGRRSVSRWSGRAGRGLSGRWGARLRPGWRAVAAVPCAGRCWGGLGGGSGVAAGVMDAGHRRRAGWLRVGPVRWPGPAGSAGVTGTRKRRRWPEWPPGVTVRALRPSRSPPDAGLSAVCSRVTSKRQAEERQAARVTASSCQPSSMAASASPSREGIR